MRGVGFVDFERGDFVFLILGVFFTLLYFTFGGRGIFFLRGFYWGFLGGGGIVDILNERWDLWGEWERIVGGWERRVGEWDSGEVEGRGREGEGRRSKGRGG